MVAVVDAAEQLDSTVSVAQGASLVPLVVVAVHVCMGQQQGTVAVAVGRSHRVIGCLVW